MAALFEGITVKLYIPTEVGKDAFNAPIYSEIPVEVKNVLVSPVESTDVVTDLELYGKRAVYELCIPKGDTNTWEDRTVEFFGQKWRTFGFVREWIENLLPLDWNKKIRVERYG